MAYNVAGTFTDVLVFDEQTGELTDTKVLSTDDPSEGVVTGIERVCDKVGISFVNLRLLFHGTTVVTNSRSPCLRGGRAEVPNIPCRDCLIARIPIENDLLLLHDDRDFERMAEDVPELKLT